MSRQTRGPGFHVGTSGWHYAHWVGAFYPRDLKKQDFLAHYSSHLSTVEINNTFYRLPAPETLSGWRRTAPEDFVFAVKASRVITHLKKLKDPDRTTARFFEVIRFLGRSLGPVLFQLPPRFRANRDRLESFLAALPAEFRYAFEFRDESWFKPEIYDCLATHHSAFCFYHLAGRQSPAPLTADFVYVRLHGPGGPYRGIYDRRTLLALAHRILDWRRGGREVHCYFDNDERGYAAANALDLQAILREEGGAQG